MDAPGPEKAFSYESNLSSARMGLQPAEHEVAGYNSMLQSFPTIHPLHLILQLPNLNSTPPPRPGGSR